VERSHRRSDPLPASHFPPCCNIGRPLLPLIFAVPSILLNFLTVAKSVFPKIFFVECADMSDRWDVSNTTLLGEDDRYDLRYDISAAAGYSVSGAVRVKGIIFLLLLSFVALTICAEEVHESDKTASKEPKVEHVNAAAADDDDDEDKEHDDDDDEDKEHDDDDDDKEGGSDHDDDDDDDEKTGKSNDKDDDDDDKDKEHDDDDDDKEGGSDHDDDDDDDDDNEKTGKSNDKDDDDDNEKTGKSNDKDDDDDNEKATQTKEANDEL